jgi:hypothetical protein
MNNSALRLSEKATLTWKIERPMKEAARLELRARYLQAVRQKLLKMFGSGYEINTGIDKNGDITAKVDDLKFSTFIYNEEVITIIPVVTCPSCAKEVFIGAVNDLAEVGEALEEFKLGLRHQCR